MKYDFWSYLERQGLFLIIGMWIALIVASLVKNNLSGNIETNILVFTTGLTITVIPKWFSQNDLTTISLTLIFCGIYFAVFSYIMPMIYGSHIILSTPFEMLMGLITTDIKIFYLIFAIILVILSCFISKMFSEMKKI